MTEQVRSIVAQFVDDESVVDEIVNALVDAKCVRYELSASKEINKTEIAIREYMSEGRTTGEIAKLTGLSFQNVRYYVLKIHSQKDGKRYGNLKELSK